MKRLLKCMLCLLGLVFIYYFTASYAVQFVSDRAVARIPSYVKDQGVYVENISFSSARVAGVQAVVWRDVATRFRLDRPGVVDSSIFFNLSISRLSLSIEDLWSRTFRLRAEGSRLVPEDSLQPSSVSQSGNLAANSKPVSGLTEAQFSNVLFDTAFSVDIDKPLESIKTLVHRIKRFMMIGSAEGEIHFTSDTRFTFRDMPLNLKISSVFDGSRSAIKVGRDDVLRITQAFKLDLTDDEIQILVDNPLKTSGLIAIKNLVNEKSSAASLASKDFPEDAYRHLLWSYLLTKKYGSEFAQAVTDAHEVGATGNTVEEQEQDYNNNALGREYALGGVSESKLLHLVKSDQRVITKHGRGWQANRQ